MSTVVWLSQINRQEQSDSIKWYKTSNSRWLKVAIFALGVKRKSLVSNKNSQNEVWKEVSLE